MNAACVSSRDPSRGRRRRTDTGKGGLLLCPSESHSEPFCRS